MPFKTGDGIERPGRPKATMANRIKKDYGKDGGKLLDMMKDLLSDPKTPPRERYAVIKELLDRGWGRTVPVEVAPDQSQESIFGLPAAPSLVPFDPKAGGQ